MTETILVTPLCVKCKLRSIWFQQDGASCHMAIRMMELLVQTFGTRISPKVLTLVWSPTFPEITVSYFFPWGYLKSAVCTTKAKNLDKLKDRIRAKMLKISK